MASDCRSQVQDGRGPEATARYMPYLKASGRWVPTIGCLIQYYLSTYLILLGKVSAVGNLKVEKGKKLVLYID